VEHGISNWRERADFLLHTLHNLPEGVVVTDERGKILFANEAAGRIAGMGEKDVPPDRWAETYGTFLPDMVTPYPSDELPLARAIRGEAVSGAELFIRHERLPEGVWISVNSRPLRDERNRLRGGLIIFRDITASKRSEGTVERLSSAVEQTADVVVITNRQGEIEYVNRACEEATGYMSDGLIGRSPRVFNSNVHGEAFFRDLWDTILAGRVFRGTVTNRRKNGKLLHLQQTITPIKDTAGQITHFVSVGKDVTELKRKEEEIQKGLNAQKVIGAILRLSLEPISLDELLQRALDEILSIPWLALLKKGAIYLAEEGQSVLTLKARRGLSKDLFAQCGGGLSFGTCLCGRAAASREIVFADCVDDRHEIRYEGLRPHGHYCVPIVSKDRLIGVICLYVQEGHKRNAGEEAFMKSVANALAGTVERRRADEALKGSEERFDLAVRGTDAGIWDWDLRTNRVYFSARWKSMLGYREEEIGDSYLEWESRLNPEDRERSLAAVQDYLEDRSPDYELEHRLRHKDGSYRWILARGAAVRGAEGKPYRMVGSHIDITERKQAEESLREKETELLAAQKIQERLLPQAAPDLEGFDIAGVAHPADFAAGDHFDYFRAADGSLATVIGDVSGHGFSSALLMATTHAYLRSLSATGIRIEEILTCINENLVEETESNRFVTTIFGRIDPTARTLEYVNAGHPTGYVFDRCGNRKASLKSTSLPLAIMPGAEYSAMGPISLESGDIVLLYTDGIVEAESPRGEDFGIDRALRIVRDNLERPAREIAERLCRGVRGFIGERKQQDDLTVVVIKVS
jgi:PAS domain S-box-containing protein